MDYLIVECSNTLEFSTWGEDFGVWIPIAKERQEGGRVVKKAAMPGYAFIPKPAVIRCMGAAPAKFRVRVLWGFLSASLVPDTELAVMQQILNDEFIPAKETKAPSPKAIGDWITIKAGPFKDCTGRVVSIKPGYCRVLLGKRYVSIVSELLS
jgi:transcription antitermination factor NusG